mgnify:CR=1 FL=1
MLDVRAANGGMRCEAGAGDANAAGALRGAGLGDQRPAGSRAGMAATCGVSRRTSWLNVKGAAGPAYGCTRRIPDGAGTAGGCCAIGLRGAGRHSALVVTPGLAEGFGVWAARIAAPGISDGGASRAQRMRRRSLRSAHRPGSQDNLRTRHPRDPDRDSCSPRLPPARAGMRTR